jgi:L-asparaginase/Glu-tRNA(Gln) amidotransferase subunit D
MTRFYASQKAMARISMLALGGTFAGQVGSSKAEWST